jgi:ATPase subunit of ABC transporter with duplicated ATPase domains
MHAAHAHASQERDMSNPKMTVGAAVQLIAFICLACSSMGRRRLQVLQAVGGDAEELDLGGRKVLTRQYCSWFNFAGSDQSKPLEVLSGGERNRLQLAQVLRKAGNLLLLDEPTNDL